MRELFEMTLKYNRKDCAIAVLRARCYPLQEAPYESYDSDDSYESCYSYDSYDVLQMAADKGMKEVMSLLVGINAQFMQEDWLIDEQLPDELLQYPDFVSFLLEHRKHTPSLQLVCKARIRKELGDYYGLKIDALGLPTALKTYLAVTESPLCKLPVSRE